MCGLFGFVNYGEPLPSNVLSVLCNSLATESEVRGEHATGISFVKTNQLCILKKPKRASSLEFKVPDVTSALIGHTRHTTQGSENQNYNNHPFQGKAGRHEFSLAHNGIIANDADLKKQLKLPKTKIETDSYVCVQLLESQNKLDFGSIKYMAEKISGTFTLTLLDDNNTLYIVKGDSPLSILNFKQLGLLVYASTDSILWRAIIETPLMATVKKVIAVAKSDGIEEVNLKQGDILKIGKTGKMKKSKFKYRNSKGNFDWRRYGSRGYSEMSEDTLCSIFDAGINEEPIRDMYEGGYTLSEIADILSSMYYEESLDGDSDYMYCNE